MRVLTRVRYLTLEDVLRIKKLRQDGVSWAAIAIRFGRTSSAIRDKVMRYERERLKALRRSAEGDGVTDQCFSYTIPTTALRSGGTQTVRAWRTPTPGLLITTAGTLDGSEGTRLCLTHEKSGWAVIINRWELNAFDAAYATAEKLGKLPITWDADPGQMFASIAVMTDKQLREFQRIIEPGRTPHSENVRKFCAEHAAWNTEKEAKKLRQPLL